MVAEQLSIHEESEDREEELTSFYKALSLDPIEIELQSILQAKCRLIRGHQVLVRSAAFGRLFI